MLKATALQACYEKVPACFPDAGLKCVASSDEFTISVPPTVHLGAVINAATAQKAALDMAMRRWEETFHGRDFSIPKKFMPNVIRALFQRGRIRFYLGDDPGTRRFVGKEEEKEEEEVDPLLVLEMRLSAWQVSMDMDKPNEELREIVQRLDSDTSPKAWGAVVGGETVIGAETFEVYLGALPSSLPMLAAHGGFRVKGMIVGAAQAPDPALTIPSTAQLTHIGWPGSMSLAFPSSSASFSSSSSSSLPKAIVLPTVKDGLAVKVYGDATVEIGCVRAVYGACFLPLFDAVNVVVARATPPSPYPEPHPLPWWDKMRYQIHGNWLVTAQEMHLLHLTTPSYVGLSGPMLEASAVSLHVSKVSLFLQRALHEFCFHHFVVALPAHAPPTEVGAWAHPPTSVREHLEEGGGEGGKKGVGDYFPVLERHRFAVLPKMTVRLQYTWECLDGASPFAHHLQPNLVNPPPVTWDSEGNPPPDKYEAFRARGLKLQLDMSISAGDLPPPPPTTTSSLPSASSSQRTGGGGGGGGRSPPTPTEKERPRTPRPPPHRSHSGVGSSRPGSARSSSKNAPIPLSLRPWLIMRLDLLRWLKLVSSPPPPPTPSSSSKVRRAASSSISSSADSSTSDSSRSPARRRRTKAGGKDDEAAGGGGGGGGGKAPSPNFGRLLSGMNFQMQVEQPCVAMWPGKRLGLEGTPAAAAPPTPAATTPPASPSRPTTPTGTRTPPVPPSSSFSASSSSPPKEKEKEKETFEGRGILLLMRDLVVQNVNELLPGQELRSLTGTTPLHSRTLLNRQDAEGMSMYLMSFLRCHQTQIWRATTTTAATAATAGPAAATSSPFFPSPSTSPHAGTGGLHDPLNLSTSTLGGLGLGGGGLAAATHEKLSAFFLETARYTSVLEQLYAALSPEDFLAGTRYLEVNSDSTGEGGGTNDPMDPLYGMSVQRGGGRALSLSRSYSIDSLGSGGLTRQTTASSLSSSKSGGGGGGADDTTTPAASPRHGDMEAVKELEEQGFMLFRPTFASFVLNHQMLRPPPEAVPTYHNTDLPQYRAPTPPPARNEGIARRRRRSNPLLQSSSFGANATGGGGKSSARAERKRSGSGKGGETTATTMDQEEDPLALSAATVAPTTLVVIVTELRILWTLAARQTVNHFATQMTRHMQVYNTTVVAASGGGHKGHASSHAHAADHSDSESSSSGDEEDNELDLPPGLAWHHSQSNLMSPVYSPPPSDNKSPQGQSDLARMFLTRGEHSTHSGPAQPPAPPSLLSSTKRNRSTLMLGGVGGGLDMRSGGGGGNAGDGASRPSTASSAQRGSSGGGGGSNGAGRGKEKDYRVTFKVILLYPQVNFRSENANGSFIVAAREAYMEGRKHDKLFKQRTDPHAALTPKAVVPKGGEGSPGKKKGKVVRRPPVKLLEKLEQWLRIDNVRAYIVPLDVEVMREVHWLEVMLSMDENAAERERGASTLSAMMGMMSGGGPPGALGHRSRSASPSPSPSPPKPSTPLHSQPPPQQSQQQPYTYDFRGSAVVQEVVKDFGLTFASIAFNPAVLPAPGTPEALALAQSMGGSANGEPRRIRVSSEETVAKVLLDLPQLDWNLNSRQFYITLDVVRNVLLAAPVQTEEEEEEERIRRQRQEEQRIAEARQRAAAAGGAGGDAAMPENLDLSSKSDREILKNLVEQTLQRLYLPTLHETKLVQYCVGGGTWKVKAEEGILTKYDAVEIGFTGFSGTHVYFHDGSMDSTIQVESFWIRNVMPGPDSALFKDDVTTVMCPVVIDKQPCQRCGQAFEEDTNRPTSCVFHGCEDGTPGEFRLFTEQEIERQHQAEEDDLADSVSPVVAGTGDDAPPPPPLGSMHKHKSYQRLRVVPPTTGKWTCCGATYETAPGCRARAHVAKEVMLSVRAKSNATLIVAGFEVNPYQFLEVSIFPGADYKLTFQLTRNIVELFHTYFLTQDVQVGGHAVTDDTNTTSNLLFGKSALEQKHKAIKEKKGTSLSDRLTKNFIGGGSGASSVGAVVPTPKASPRTPPVTTVTTTTVAVPTTTNGVKESVIYMKYLRFGDLNVKVSVNGFAIKLDGYRASIPAFVRQGKVVTWKRLIRKFEKHVVWSVTTSTASSMVSGGSKSKHHPHAADAGGGGGGSSSHGGARLLLPSMSSGDDKERGVNTLFSPPPKEDRTKLLFGGK